MKAAPSLLQALGDAERDAEAASAKARAAARAEALPRYWHAILAEAGGDAVNTTPAAFAKLLKTLGLSLPEAKRDVEQVRNLRETRAALDTAEQRVAETRAARVSAAESSQVAKA